MRAALPFAALLLASGCTPTPAGNRPEERDDPTPAEVAPAEATTVAPAATDPRPIGWWKSDRVCLELFANGDFEVSIMGKGPKALVMGGTRVVGTDAKTLTLELDVTRIWHARWLGACRKKHLTGEWVESENVLGLDFAPGKATQITITPTENDQLEMCGETCATLTRQTPVLGARWRRSGMENPSDPAVPWQPGALLELDIDESGGHLWVGAHPEGFATLYGETTAASVGADAFNITFTPDDSPKLGGDAKLSVWGTDIQAGVAHTFSARRLPAQQLEVCDASSHCVTLDRQFDAYAYDLH